jgi:hypothetical protein
MPDKEYQKEIQGRPSVRCPTKSIEERYREGLLWGAYQRVSKRDAEKVFSGMPDKEYRREIQGKPSVGFLTKSIEERYREGLQ